MSGYLMQKHRWVIHNMKCDTDFYDNCNWNDHVEGEVLLTKYGYDIEKFSPKRIVNSLKEVRKVS